MVRIQAPEQNQIKVEKPKVEKKLITQKIIRKILLTILCLFFALGIVQVALAQEESQPGLTPDSPFYFLDTWQEKISLFFTFDPEKKAEKALKYAQEKIAEVQKLSEEEKAEYLDKALKKYDEYLGTAQKKVAEIKEKGINVDQLAQKVTEATLKHQETLLQVYEKVPEQAKTAISQAMEKSQQGYLKSLEAIESAAIKEQVKSKVTIFTEKTAEQLTPEQKAKIEQTQQKIQNLLEGGISPEEWAMVQQKLIELVDLVEGIIKTGLGPEQQEKILTALSQIEETILASQLTDQQKEQALTLIGQIEALVKTGLTPAQKMLLISALEQLKDIIREKPAPEKEKIEQKFEETKSKLKQGLSPEQKESIEEVEESVKSKLEGIKSRSQ